MPHPKTVAAVAAVVSTLLSSAGSGTLLAQPAAQPAVPPILQNYRPVTAERLRNPDDGDWLMIRRTYDGWGHSPLDQITTANVRQLRPVWAFATGEVSSHQAPPIVNDGVMFVATPGNQVLAFDAVTGSLLWRYRRNQRPDAIIGHRTTRGVALHGDHVYFAAADAVLVALDARTGREVWATEVGNNAEGYYMTVAPLVADGKVMVGLSGGERGIRGFVAAYDVATGQEVWKAYTVPAPGEPGSETWPDGDEWKTGGAATWVTGNYDVATNTLYWGTGNGGPWIGDQRPGDNLYSASTVAIDAATGRIRGHFQYHPNDSWDWDEVSPPLLIDFRRGGRSVPGLVNIARNGYLWFLERGADGPIRFVEGKPYVLHNTFLGLDPVTGRPNVDPERQPGTGRRADHCPSLWGGKNWPPAAFNPATRMIYFPVNNNLCGTSEGREVEYRPGASFTGAAVTIYIAPGAEHIGEVQAWNVDTGERVWTQTFPGSNWGPMLSTAGGLVFSGGTADRLFRAYDARTGEVLWQFPTPSGVQGMPVSFMVGGKQYIAVQSGWGVDARSMQSVLNGQRRGEFPEVPDAGTIWVFALD
jgi:alcohol dehydrogenase (cytochrome c)